MTTRSDEAALAAIGAAKELRLPTLRAGVAQDGRDRHPRTQSLSGVSSGVAGRRGSMTVPSGAAPAIADANSTAPLKRLSEGSTRRRREPSNASYYTLAHGHYLSTGNLWFCSVTAAPGTCHPGESEAGRLRTRPPVHFHHLQQLVNELLRPPMTDPVGWWPATGRLDLLLLDEVGCRFKSTTAEPDAVRDHHRAGGTEPASPGEQLLPFSECHVRLPSTPAWSPPLV